jgi:hypothetical protein
VRHAVRALAWCAALGACGGFAAAPQRAAGADKPGPVPRAQLERWIANDEAALRGPARTSPGAYGAHLASLLNELWLAHRDGRLAQVLPTIGARLPGASNDRADTRFLHGDHVAPANGAAMIERLRRVREGARPDGRSIDAALAEGDVYAACGRFRSARITWYRAFSTSVLQPPRSYRFFPAWTSAMRRLVRYRSVPDRASAGRCRALPPPLVDPVG